MVKESVKEPKLGESYLKPISKPSKQKKFNLLEEQIKYGWAKLKGTGYDPNELRGLEKLWIALIAFAVVGINYLKGFVGIFDLAPYIPAVLTLSSALLFSSAYFIFSEAIWHFAFLFRKMDKPDFWGFTLPFKTLSYILGGVVLVYTPVATVLGLIIIPYLVNHAYALHVTRRNFDDRARYYAPEEFKEEAYEEPIKKETPKQPPQRPAQQSPPSTGGGFVGGPKIESIESPAFIQAANSFISTTDDNDLGLTLPSISLNQLSDFLGKLGF